MGARGAVMLSVLVLAAVAGTALAGPDANTAVKKVTKKFVKQKAKKEAKKYFNKNIGDASVASAQSAQEANSAATATNADNATNAATANGVTPEKIDYAAASGSGETVLFDQAGIQIRGECQQAPTVVALLAYSTTPNGVITASSISDHDILGTETFLQFDTDFDPPSDELFLGGGGPGSNGSVATLSYRGADGSTVTGELQVQRLTAVASCVVSGTLFVG